MKHEVFQERRQSGTVMIEACLWVAFFAFLIPVLADTFFLTNAYLSLNQITRQAIVTEMEYPESLANVGQFSAATPSSDAPTISEELAKLDACTQGHLYKQADNFQPYCAQAFVEWRIRRLIESHDVKILPENIRVETSMDMNKLMTVKLVTTFDAYSFFFKGKRITNTASASFIGG